MFKGTSGRERTEVLYKNLLVYKHFIHRSGFASIVGPAIGIKPLVIAANEQSHLTNQFRSHALLLRNETWVSGVGFRAFLTPFTHNLSTVARFPMPAPASCRLHTPTAIRDLTYLSLLSFG